jgi:kynurenine formamidase
VGEVTMRADGAVARARHAEAEKYAPYWWTRATEYLHKARERAAYADFQGANRFGRLAAEAAEQAIVDAKDWSKRPIDPDESLPADEPTPAKDAPAKAAPAKDAPAKDAPAKDAPVPAKVAPAPAKDAP